MEIKRSGLPSTTAYPFVVVPCVCHWIHHIPLDTSVKINTVSVTHNAPKAD
jgi:hypothetical protein